MYTSCTATRLLLFLLIAGLINTPVRSEEKSTESTQKESQSASEEDKDDIWREISFESEKDLQLTEKQISHILNELRKTNPSKAQEIEKLKDSDPEAYIEAIREQIGKQIEASKELQVEQPPEPAWKRHLDLKHEEFLAWFQEHYHEDYAEVSQLQTSDPETFAQRVIDLIKIYGPIQKMEQYNPDLAAAMKKNLELQKQRDALLLQIRITPKQEQAKIIEDLKAVVSQRFDTIVQEKQLQYDWLRGRLAKLTQRLETRADELETLRKTKDESVEARLKELIERTEKVNWN